MYNSLLATSLVHYSFLYILKIYVTLVYNHAEAYIYMHCVFMREQIFFKAAGNNSCSLMVVILLLTAVIFLPAFEKYCS